MTCSERKARARQVLGGGIFQSPWLMAVVASLIFGALTGAAGSALPAVGSMILIGPLTYGLHYLHLKRARDGQPMELGDIFKGFTNDFGQTFLIGLLSSLFVALWGLLLVIPGIIKAYSYALVYYIKIDNPNFTWRECLQCSTQMMRGHKADLFWQNLSFLGWAIVGSLCLGVGTLWVTAYIEASRAQFYLDLTTRSYRNFPEF